MSILGTNFTVEVLLYSFHSFTLLITLPFRQTESQATNQSHFLSLKFSKDREILIIILRRMGLNVFEDEGNFHPCHLQITHPDFSHLLYLTYSFPVFNGQLLKNSLQINHEQFVFQSHSQHTVPFVTSLVGMGVLSTCLGAVLTGCGILDQIIF